MSMFDLFRVRHPWPRSSHDIDQADKLDEQLTSARGRSRMKRWSSDLPSCLSAKITSEPKTEHWAAWGGEGAMPNTGARLLGSK
jgi:hypothetical protein